MLHIPESLLGREVELGCVTVTAEVIVSYADSVGDTPTIRGEAPPTFLSPETEINEAIQALARAAWGCGS